jgi:hypothetical protein
MDQELPPNLRRWPDGEAVVSTSAAAQGSAWRIVEDILEAYGWRMTLDRSKLGGLRVAIGPQRDSDFHETVHEQN